jgi:ethanolamine utilization protein EutP
VRKIIFMGAIGCGKTTLCQAIQEEELRYHKTQAVSFYPDMIDTPGEFILHRQYYNALNVTAADARVIGLVQSVIEQEQIFSPGFASIFGKTVIGIVSKADLAKTQEEIERIKVHLLTAGAKKIYVLSSFDRLGIAELVSDLEEME